MNIPHPLDLARAADSLGEAVAEATFAVRLFGDAVMTANAASGGKLFAEMRADAQQENEE